MMPALPLLQQQLLQLLNVGCIASGTPRHVFAALEHLRQRHSRAGRLHLSDGCARGKLPAAAGRAHCGCNCSRACASDFGGVQVESCQSCAAVGGESDGGCAEVLQRVD
jgi:hypothetical protein